MKSTEIIKPSVMTAPLAYEGDRNVIPANSTGTNKASVQEGFPAVTSLAKSDGGLPPTRADFNGMFYLSTDQRTYLQNGGVITFSDAVSDAIGGYPKGAILDYVVGSDYAKVRSLIEDNTYNFNEDASFIDDEKWEFLDFSGGGSGAGAPVGSIFPTFCAESYIPLNCLPCNGSEYRAEQFGLFYTNYLVSGKLLTCTYDEYASSIEQYGKCAKFAVDATIGTFKTPYIPDGSFIQQAFSDGELGKAYNAGLPDINISATTGSAGAHTHNRGSMEIAGSVLASDMANGAVYSGAFYTSGGLVKGTHVQNSTGGQGYNINFKASRNWTGSTSSNGAHTHSITVNNNSSSVYGKSTTVQPESIALRWFVVVGTGAINDADMNWSEWATSLNGRANTDLSNLSEIGGKHFVNKTQITNCITEIPQRIKYTLIDGVLTIKAGSVVIVPYGVEDLTATYPVGSTFLNNNFKVVDTQYADGKFFVWAELQQDISHSHNNMSGNDLRAMYVNFSTGALTDKRANISGTNPTATKTYTGAYNITTNLVGQSYDSTTITYTDVLSFPVIKTKPSEPIMHGVISEVYNGMGVIGSIVWIDKGIKGLMPNGRNSDSTINNLFYETTELMFYDQSGLTGGRSIVLQSDGTFRRSTGYHVNQEGYLEQNDNNFVFTGFVFANIYASSGQVTSFTPRAAFQAANAQDLDGQWTRKVYDIIASKTTLTKNTIYEYDLSSYLPNDNNVYEVYICCTGNTPQNTANFAGADIRIGSALINVEVAPFASTTARTNGTVNFGSSTIIPIGSDKKIKLKSLGDNTELLIFRCLAYRKVR